MATVAEQLADLQQKIIAVEWKVTAHETTLKGLDGRLSDPKQIADAEQTLPGLKDRLTALEGQIDSATNLGKRVDTLAGASSDLDGRIARSEDYSIGAKAADGYKALNEQILPPAEIDVQKTARFLDDEKETFQEATSELGERIKKLEEKVS